MSWHCFRNSCGAKGVKGYERSISEVKRKLLHTVNNDEQGNGAPIPDVLVSILNHEHCLEYVKRNNCYESYINGLVSIYYSPVDNRAMFAMGMDNPNIIKGYTGRALGSQIPKWKRYGNCEGLFTCGNGPIAVLVEDAPSACAVGILPEYTGVALLGTNLTAIHKESLLKFQKVIICLDPDAARKSLKISDQLNNSVVRLIPDDLKYYKPNEIREILEGN